MRQSLLLLLLAAFTVLGASAQLSQSGKATPAQAVVLSHVKPAVQVRSAHMREPGSPLVKEPRKALRSHYNSYRRPAGAFSSNFVVRNGVYAGCYLKPRLTVKPYTYYTFKANVDGMSSDAEYVWASNNGENNDDEYVVIPPFKQENGYTIKWDIGVYNAPVLYVFDDGLYYWCLHGSEPDDSSFDPEFEGYIISYPNTIDYDGMDYLKSSKSFIYGGRNGDQNNLMTFYSGAKPYGDNKNGWWFGKNAGSSRGNAIDGIAQAFEKPTAPYLLRQVVLDCGILEVAGPVDMTCKIYKLDEIPAYDDSLGVALPEEPGELLYTGRATLTPETAATTGDLVFFDLYDVVDGLEVDVTPTIDCAILVVIDGYNEPDMANLTDFTASISSDIHADEGFGELAYLKFGVNDENGNLDHYVWAGLNRFFGGEDDEMKTGFSIFLIADNPYLVYSASNESDEYVFGEQGGAMERQNGDTIANGIQFMSSTPSCDGDWTMTCNGDDLPDWLDIVLIDGETDGKFKTQVTAIVKADPLPEGVTYREAVVRFAIPGDYKDFKFIQGVKEDPVWPWWPDEPNISTVNWIIDIILGAQVSDKEMKLADVNQDGVVNISDVNAVIDIILRD